MDIQTLHLGAGLVILIVVNIILGSLSALFVKAFDWNRLVEGALKGFIVIVCFAATYFVGYINPNVVAINITGIELNILNAIQIVVLAGYYYYAKQVIVKLTSMVNGSLYVDDIIQGHKKSENDNQ